MSAPGDAAAGAGTSRPVDERERAGVGEISPTAPEDPRAAAGGIARGGQRTSHASSTALAEGSVRGSAEDAGGARVSIAPTPRDPAEIDPANAPFADAVAGSPRPPSTSHPAAPPRRARHRRGGSRGARGVYPTLSLDDWDPSGSVAPGATGTTSMPHAMPPGFDPRRAGATSHWRDASAPGQIRFYDGAAYDTGGYYRAGEFGAYHQHPSAGYGMSGMYGGVIGSQTNAFHPSMPPAQAYGNANQWASWEHHAARFGGAPGFAGDPRAAGPPGGLVGGSHAPPGPPYDMSMDRIQRGGGSLGGGWSAAHAAGGPSGGWIAARGGGGGGGFLMDPMRGGAASMGAQGGDARGRDGRAWQGMGVPHMQGTMAGYRGVAPPDTRPGVPESRSAAGLHTVHVRDVHASVTERDVAAAFEDCGPVADCRLCSDPQSGARYAFVAFPTKSGARAALSKSGSEIGGHPVRVVLSRTSVIPVNPSLLPQSADEMERCARTVYVANVHRNSREEDVRVFFETDTAAVTGVLLQRNPRVASQVAFVEFATVEAAQAALRRSGRELDGRALRVSQSKTPLRLGGARGAAGRGSASGSRAGAAGGVRAAGPAPPSEPAPPGQRSARGWREGLEGSTTPSMQHAVRVSNVSATVTESALARVFSGCGRVLDCRLAGDAHSSFLTAFVAFPDATSVEHALTLDGFSIDGVVLVVRRSTSAVVPVNPDLLPRSEEDVERCARTVYVSNVCAGVDAATLRSIFVEACGEVRNAHQRFAADKETQVTFVEFATAEAAAKALTVSGRLVGSRQLRVSPSKTPLKANKNPPSPKSDEGGAETKTNPSPSGLEKDAAATKKSDDASANDDASAVGLKSEERAETRATTNDGSGGGESELEREIKRLNALAVSQEADAAAAEAARRKSNDSTVSGSSEGDTAVA
jgi:RNA recognition motif-containing protein